MLGSALARLRLSLICTAKLLLPGLRTLEPPLSPPINTNAKNSGARVLGGGRAQKFELFSDQLSFQAILSTFTSSFKLENPMGRKFPTQILFVCELGWRGVKGIGLGKGAHPMDPM